MYKETNQRKDELLNKNVIDISYNHLVDIYNSILDFVDFPEQWLEGIIIPINKNNDSKNVHYYRFITLVSCCFFTKKVIRFINLAEYYDVESDVQFGFRK